IHLRRNQVCNVCYRVVVLVHFPERSCLVRKARRTLVLSGFLLVLCLGIPAASQAKPVDISAGFDLFETAPGTTTVTFKGPDVLPPGFFGAGSEAFRGTVPLEGVPIAYFHHQAIGLADTIVHRLDPAFLPTLTSTVTIPIELTSL